MQGSDCSCRGENPNCFKCDGTGLALGRAPQIGRPYTPIGRYTYVFERKYLQSQGSMTCTQVQIKDPSDKSERVIAVKNNRHHESVNCRDPKDDQRKCSQKELTDSKHYPSSPSDFQSFPGQETRNNSVAPPNPDRRKLNVKKAKSASSRQRINQLAMATLKFSSFQKKYPKAVMCQLCYKLQSDREELSMHLSLVHHIFRLYPKSHNRHDTVAKTSKVQRLGKGNDRCGDDFVSLTPGYSRGEKSMDATYGIGGFAREHGRFGSACSYDEMGDESNP